MCGSKRNAIEGKLKVAINKDAVDKDLKLAGYNLLVTSETKMKAGDIYNTYHNLSRIEESFKVMKSYLNNYLEECRIIIYSSELIVDLL